MAEKVVNRCSLTDSAFTGEATSSNGDGVYNYAWILCHHGSLVMEFRDAWAKGDGERVLRCWKLFLPHFKASGCSKYSLEALRLQICDFTPHLPMTDDHTSVATRSLDVEPRFHLSTHHLPRQITTHQLCRHSLHAISPPTTSQDISPFTTSGLGVATEDTGISCTSIKMLQLKKPNSATAGHRVCYTTHVKYLVLQNYTLLQGLTLRRGAT